VKVIGIIPERWSDNRFIVEMDAKEMSRLLGHYYAEGHIKQLEVGAEVQIAAMWDHLYKLSSVQGDIDKVRTSLLAAAKLLDGLPEPLKEVKCGPDEKGAKS
jgi:hypothetical protein